MKEQKQKPAEPLDEAEYADKLRIQKKRRTRWLAAAAVLLVILFFVPQLFLQNYLPDKFRIEQLNILNIFGAEKAEQPAQPESAQESTTGDEGAGVQSDTAAESAPLENAEEESETAAEVIDETGNYYIILGSFEFISDAVRNKKQWDSQFSKTFEVFSTDDGSYVVGIPADGSKQKAESALLAYTTGTMKPYVMERE